MSFLGTIYSIKFFSRDLSWKTSDDLDDLDVFDDENAEGDRQQQVFEFVETPSFVTLLIGSQVEPLHLAQITEETVAESRL